MAWVGSPEFLNTKTYPAVRDRVVLSHMGGQPGVYDDNDFLAQATGTGLNVTAQPGHAMVQASHPTLSNKGFYHVTDSAPGTFQTVSLAAAHASLPRIDQLFLVVKDPSYDPTLVTSLPVLQAVTGTPTSGATLDNRSGAASGASLPPSALRLADIIVPAGTSTLLSTHIRDRRTFCRGINKRVLLTGLAEAAIASATPLELSNARIRAEISGYNPVEVTLQGSVYTNNTGGATLTYIRLGGGYFKASTGIAGGLNLLEGGVLTASSFGGYALNSTQHQGAFWKVSFMPSALTSGQWANDSVGSVLFAPWIAFYEPTVVGFEARMLQGGTGGTEPLTFSVRELMYGDDVTYATS